jgi:hypothetical protein
MDADHKIPKWRTRVDVQMPNGQVFAVAVYLSENATDHTGPERLSELLNRSQDFIPAFDLERDQTLFLCRRNLSVVRALLDIEADPDEQHTLPEEVSIRVVVQGGRDVEGTLTYVRPDGRDRVIDFLNEPPMFFPVLEKDRVALVNKQHVIRVELLNPRTP